VSLSIVERHRHKFNAPNSKIKKEKENDWR
jgi:hypothetical protein